MDSPVFFLVEQRNLKFDQKCDINLSKFKNIESPKMVSKRLNGHNLRSYEQFMIFDIQESDILEHKFSPKPDLLL